MRRIDLLGMGLAALIQQKVRTALTLLGVVISTVVLTLSISLGQGVQAHVDRAFGRQDYLRRISLSPGRRDDLEVAPPEAVQVEGDMSEAKRVRIRRALARRWRYENILSLPDPLTPDRLQGLANLNHVERVFPIIHEPGVAQLEGGPSQVVVFTTLLRNQALRKCLLAGEFQTADAGQEILVTEFLLYLWGMRDDAAPHSALGKSVRLRYFAEYLPGNPFLSFTRKGPKLTPEELQSLARALRQLPGALEDARLSAEDRAVLRRALEGLPPEDKAPSRIAFEGEFTIVGVLGDPSELNKEEPYSYLVDQPILVLPQRTAEAICTHSTRIQEHGYNDAWVMVDRIDHVEEVMDRLRERGLHPSSEVFFIRQLQKEIFFISVASGLLAAIALLVAALGITNTMLMSVIERTREIGILKAVGARDRQVQGLFQIEAGLLGVLGGLVGLLLSWLASFPLEGVAQTLIEKQLNEKVQDTLFLFPVWLLSSVPFFTGVVTMLAAWYPARRAAKMDPIRALRHE